jgi:hypothetical protein
MKTWKIIMLCVLSSLLTLSLFFNIFFLTIFGAWTPDGFKKALLGTESVYTREEVETPTDNSVVEVPDTTPPDTSPDTEVEVPDNSFGIKEGEAVYFDNGITITYMKQEEGLLGPRFKFFVENNYSHTIYVAVRNVYIDGILAELSGGSQSDIEVGKKAFLEINLWSSDYEDYTDDPTKVEFDILIMHDDNWETLFEINDIVLQVK